MNPDEENPFWGEPTPTDLWDDMKLSLIHI